MNAIIYESIDVIKELLPEEFFNVTTEEAYIPTKAKNVLF